MKLRPYQSKVKDKLLPILYEHGVAYLAGEMRTGKTLISLATINEYFPKPHTCKVLFVTAKKAIPDIKDQYKRSLIKFRKFIVTNYESIHKVQDKIDFIVLDEAHKLGSLRKPGKAAKLINKMFYEVPTLLMSGTPSPETYSMLFHQFWATGLGPWAHYSNFYRWAKKYIKVEKMYIGMGLNVNNYKKAKPIVMEQFKDYCVSVSQKQASFKGKVIEHFHTIPTPAKIQLMLSVLKNTGVLDKPQLVADSAAKMSSYFHQLSSGTVIDTDKNYHKVDDFKVRYLKDNFEAEDLAIFYLFKSEGEILRKAYPKWTSDPKVFKQGGKTFLCQVRAGSLGVDLATSYAIVFFNISYSAVTYWQARARGQSQAGGDTDVHWLFSSRGVESSVYEAVVNKKDYTLKHFKDYVGSIQAKAHKGMASKTKLGRNPIEGNGTFRTARPYGTKKRRSLVHRSKTTRRRTK